MLSIVDANPAPPPGAETPLVAPLPPAPELPEAVTIEAPPALPPCVGLPYTPPRLPPETVFDPRIEDSPATGTKAGTLLISAP